MGFSEKGTLQRILLEFFDVTVDALKFTRDGNRLRAVGEAFAAVDAVFRLAEGRDGPVVTDQVGPLELLIIFLFLCLRVAAFRDGCVVVFEDAGDVDAPRAWHAVFAVGAVDGGVFHHLGGHPFQEIQFFFGEGLEVCEGLDVVQERIHVGHAAQSAQDARVGAAEAESPGRDRLVGLALLHLLGDGIRDVGQTTAQQGFHDDDRDAALVQFFIEIGSIGISPAVGMVPVDEVHCNLDEVPVVSPAVVQGDEFVEFSGCAMEGESQIADASCFLLLDEEFHHPVLHVALFESRDAATADGVQEIIVEIVRLQLLEGILVHPDRPGRRP